MAVETIEQRIDALGVRGVKTLLADLADVYPGDVTHWAAGRLVAHRHAAAAKLDHALEQVELAQSYIRYVTEQDGIPPALTVENVRALTAIRTDSERIVQTA